MNLPYLQMFLVNGGSELSWPRWAGPLMGGALGALREESFLAFWERFTSVSRIKICGKVISLIGPLL